MAVMSKLQAAYLAGLIDGEGYIGILKNKHGEKSVWSSTREYFFTPVLKVAMTDRELIEWLYKSFGGTFETRKAKGNAKESYCWSMRKSQVQDFLKLLYPFLQVKKRDADIIFRFMKTNNGAGHPISEENHLIRIKLYEEIRKLHSRGAPVETK